MGLSLDSLWQGAKQAAEQGMEDMLKIGGNAALGYLEGQAIAILEADKRDKEKAMQNHIATTLQRPGSPNSFGAYLSNAAQSPILKQYGPYIVGFVVSVALVTLVMKKG